MATPAEVDATLKDLLRRLDDADTNGRALPERRSLVVHIRDHGIHYTAVFSEGRIGELVQGAPAGNEDVRITVSSDDLIALATGRMGVGGALLTGRLRIDAGMRDLLLIRQLF